MSNSSQENDSHSSLKVLRERLIKSFESLSAYIRITRAQKILRRYFAMNAFDGSMTSLGVVIGAYISSIVDPKTIISVIIVGGIAMAVSGFSGTYFSESAERRRSLNELEDAMLMDLENTLHGKATRVISVFAAFVDGSAPFIASIPSVVPFYLTFVGLVPIRLAFLASICASLVTLFFLGAFLGRVREGNVIYSGIKMVFAGIAVALLALLINGGR